MKRLLAVLFALSILLCACSENAGEDNTGSNTTVAGDDSASESENVKPLETVDLDGFELHILTYDKTWFTWANTDMDAEELNGEILNDALFSTAR